MNLIKKVEYKNQFGETMTLGLDDQNNAWFKHEDCNDEFENLNNIYVDYNIKGKVIKCALKYVLDEDEKVVLRQFVKDINFKAPTKRELIVI